LRPAYLRNYSITNSMEQSPWEANSHSASQEIPCFFHNSLPLVPMLNHMRTVRTFPPYFPKIHSNILQLCLGLPSRLFPSGFTTKNCYALLISPMRATCPTHLTLLQLLSVIILGEAYRTTAQGRRNTRMCARTREKVNSAHALVSSTSTYVCKPWRHCLSRAVVLYELRSHLQPPDTSSW
jgi:hypothetical protein